MIAPVLLDDIPLLAGLGADASALLAANGVERHHPAGHVLYTAGSAPAGLIFIVAGMIRVVRGHGTRQHLIHEEHPGGVLGAVALFGGTPYPATAVAGADVRCLVVPTAVLHGAMRLDPDLALRFLHHLAARARHLVERVDGLASRTITARLARHLLERASAASNAPFTLGRSQVQMAEELGTVREVVVRALRQLCDDGVLARAGRSQYRVAAAERLRALADR